MDSKHTNPLDIVFKGFSPSKEGKETIEINGAKHKGKWLCGSLIRINKEPTEYYIHNGGYQNHSGYRYIPKATRVIPETVHIID